MVQTQRKRAKMFVNAFTCVRVGKSQQPKWKSVVSEFKIKWFYRNLLFVVCMVIWLWVAGTPNIAYGVIVEWEWQSAEEKNINATWNGVCEILST